MVVWWLRALFYLTQQVQEGLALVADAVQQLTSLLQMAANHTILQLSPRLPPAT